MVSSRCRSTNGRGRMCVVLERPVSRVDTSFNRSGVGVRSTHTTDLREGSGGW